MMSSASNEEVNKRMAEDAATHLRETLQRRRQCDDQAELATNKLFAEEMQLSSIAAQYRRVYADVVALHPTLDRSSLPSLPPPEMGPTSANALPQAAVDMEQDQEPEGGSRDVHEDEGAPSDTSVDTPAQQPDPVPAPSVSAKAEAHPVPPGGTPAPARQGGAPGVIQPWAIQPW
jgi:hypothetical protein